MKNKILTIAIPTFQRSTRLRKNLSSLLLNINILRLNSSVEIYVSNNGSKDKTKEVLREFFKEFKKFHIQFNFTNQSINRGFDSNVLSCFYNAKGKYIWFLSDDDNIYNDSLLNILKDIKKYSPNIIVYNFNQHPYTKLNPHIRQNSFYKLCNKSFAIDKIVSWPKLSTLVVKRNSEIDSVMFEKYNGEGFMHLAICIGCFFKEGRLLLSNKFIGFPDDDYMDNIDFVPWIQNGLYNTVRGVCLENGRFNILEKLQIKKVDTLIVSINYFSSYLRGKIAVNSRLRRQILIKIISEIKLLSFIYSNKRDLFYALFKLFYSIFYHIIFFKNFLKLK